ncbi:hypothetical protein GOODEAATRI_032969 [Goodea atripinnis]|uniref:Uncharacterized protein n=1 Tax=Goodea atripinnis TaxID=208336 RepID=A0ABV0NZV8_9TELE
MDDLLCRAYDSSAQMGRIGNSLSHLLLGLSSSLESVPLDQSTQGLLDASLQAFALMTRELGRTLWSMLGARTYSPGLPNKAAADRWPVAAGAAGGSMRGSFPPPVPFLGSTSMARAHGDYNGDQASRPVWAAQSGQRFPRPSRGQGARR